MTSPDADCGTITTTCTIDGASTALISAVDGVLTITSDPSQVAATQAVEYTSEIAELGLTTTQTFTIDYESPCEILERTTATLP